MDKQEPYRATKLWNEVIYAFRNGVPLKKHRRRMQTHNNCFSASDCITWLHCYLQNNPNFGPDVTRQQTIQLLQKFVKCHVIESITLKSKRYEFSDNSHLYRFTQVPSTPSKIFPLRRIQSPLFDPISEKLPKELNKQVPEKNSFKAGKENIPECHFIQKKLSVNQIDDIWKTSVLLRLESLLSSMFGGDILDIKVLNGSNVKHNTCRLSNTGVVSLIDKTDDIPHWVTSAMKCLVNWPNASGSGSCLPNYPGFEKDVFKVVRDYFLNPQISLLPEYISSPLVAVFSIFFKRKFSGLTCVQTVIKPDVEKVLDFIPKPFITANEAKTSTPVHNDSLLNIPPPNSMLYRSIEAKILLDDPEVMWDYPSNVHFETEFSTTIPVTRMVAERNSFSNLFKSSAQSLTSLHSVSTISMCSQFREDPDNGPVVVYDDPIHQTPNKLWNSAINLNIKIPTQESGTIKKSNRPRNLLSENGMTSGSLGSLNVLRKSQSFCDYPVPSSNLKKVYYAMEDMNHEYYDEGKPDLNTSGMSTRTITNNENVASDDGKLSEKFSSTESNCTANQYMVWDRKCGLSSDEKFKSRNVSNIDLSASWKKTDGDLIQMKENLKEIFQLVLLFLPPPNRRQLHLLLRVINKIVKNGKFVLDSPLPMRDYLLETFLPAIVQSDCNQKILFDMASFILGNCEALFQPPCSIKQDVENSLVQAQSGKIKYSLDDTCALTYCELVSKQQYENQKVSVSMQALKELLESLLKDENITARERKKKLKKFKENHPEVYFQHFPRSCEEDGSKSKKTFLSKLVKLRL